MLTNEIPLNSCGMKHSDTFSILGLALQLYTPRQNASCFAGLLISGQWGQPYLRMNGEAVEVARPQDEGDNRLKIQSPGH